MQKHGIIIIFGLALILGFVGHKAIQKFINPKASALMLALYFLLHFLMIFLIAFMLNLLAIKFANRLF